MDLPLEGIRVIDLTQVMAGPFCTQILGDFGADVIKVEPPITGDLSRSMGGTQLRMRGDDNAPFLALNRNKRSIVIDLKSDSGRSVFRSLVESADVVVESYRPGVVARLGIDYSALSSINERLVYASISGFGQTGPHASRPGFDLIAQGMAGLLSVTGNEGEAPVKCGVPVADLSAGLYATIGIMAALLARRTTGRGQYVETSLFEAALGLSVWESTEYWATGKPPRPLGSAHRLNAPYQALRTADGWITVAALTSQQWESLCSVLSVPGLAIDPRFSTNTARMAAVGELADELERALSVEATDIWVDRLLAAGVPAGPIHDYARVFDDAHTRARHMVAEIEHPVEGLIRTLGFPIKLNDTPARVRRPPPLLGEHTAELLRELAESKHTATTDGADRAGSE